MDASVFDHHEGPWTEDDHLALLRHPGQERVEVVDGTLLIGPRPPERRRAVAERVRAGVAAALPDGLAVVGPVPLRLGADCVLVPDLIVVPAEAAAALTGPAAEAGADAPTGDHPLNGSATAGGADEDAGDGSSTAEPAPPRDLPRVLDAAAALLVIELVGRDHGAVARTFKPQVYARSGIPYSLLVDHDVPFAAADMIISGRYHEYASTRADDPVLRIDEPFSLELDLRAITTPAPAEAPPPLPVPTAAATV